MALLLRKTNAQARIQGCEPGWGDADYTVLDDERIVGRICREMLLGESKWRWFLNTSPHAAPVPHNGVCNSLDEAKAAFKERYEQVKENDYR
jgi:hypothetical protein